ncbi:hypothetical protein LJ656_34795 [Paraburkholderia sp. MMS20-SJTR3]|uniref:Uncharacterized protein n=1 Tax=Paraburkholderia sejongensis TaxID=2886946 RepID=A0ABS8K6B8_9BURK|nr:hypothetical protein [Paraburkholderia sp. MMS20-SJTR3]MCC8397701.1 hypothetical protein [Paraburkholderia sp. MMS20-SJTR3]
MRQTVTDAQRSVARSILTTAMAVLRDDQPFNPANTVFGHNFAAEPLPGTPGMEYRFENPVLPRTRVTLYTHEDPADHSFDRASVKRVPTAFTVSFSPLMEGITRSDLENLLSLDIGYWIDGHGDRWPSLCENAVIA